MNKFEIGTALAIITGVVFIVRLEMRVAELEKKQDTPSEQIVQELQAFAAAPRTPGPLFTFNNTPQTGQSPAGWGNWSDPLYCPAGQYVCGLQQSVEPLQGRTVRDDDTAMNAVAFFCCPLDPDIKP